MKTHFRPKRTNVAEFEHHHKYCRRLKFKPCETCPWHPLCRVIKLAAVNEDKNIEKSSQLDTARAELKKVEEKLGDHDKLIHFKNGITSLQNVISKGSAKIEKDIAQKIALAYKNRVLSEVNFILDNVAYYEARALEHWINVMEVLMAAGFDDDAVLNTSKKQLLSRLDLQSIEHLSPVELDTLEKELRAALESLSLHKGRLSNIKISTQK